MRLTGNELTSIRTILRRADAHGRVWLFGSRTDDQRRGGDIDIFFEPTQALDLKMRLALQYQLTCACGTQVDLLVKNPDQSETDIFDLARQGVCL